MKIISNSLDDWFLFQQNILGFMAAAALFQRVVEHQFGIPKPAVARATYDMILGQCLRFRGEPSQLENINLHQLKQKTNAMAKRCSLRVPKLPMLKWPH